jgi:hypothetical protein
MRTATGYPIFRGTCVLVAIALLCGVPGSALGQAPQSLTVTTSTGPQAKEAGYHLRIQTAAEGAAFGFQYDLPSWPTTEPVLGSPVRVSSVGLSGPGSIRPSAQGAVPKPILRRGNACVRELAAPYLQRYWVEMPANSVSVVNLQVRGTYPAWPGTKYGVSFSTFAFDDPSAQLLPLGAINVPRFMPRGTRIALNAKGEPGKQATPELAGRTYPPFRGARIALRAVRPALSGRVRLEDWGDPRPPAISLGSVTTDRHGRFRVPPRRLTAEGSFAVIARSEARGSRAADWNCGAFFSLG